jgi:RimJ/RimL family protein N-acetyltransferase
LKEILIKKLGLESAKELSDLLQNENSEYSKYFIPFEFDIQTISNKIKNLNRDSFWGIYVNDKIVGLYMLRGFDEGYEIPSYGVWISKEFAGKGLSKLTLQHAISYCRINLIKEIMLKVHPENLIAKKIYEDFGFIKTGVDSSNNNFIYRKKL